MGSSEAHWNTTATTTCMLYRCFQYGIIQPRLLILKEEPKEKKRRHRDDIKSVLKNSHLLH
jgi:hypothetical protein